MPGVLFTIPPFSSDVYFESSIKSKNKRRKAYNVKHGKKLKLRKRVKGRALRINIVLNVIPALQSSVGAVSNVCLIWSW